MMPARLLTCLFAVSRVVLVLVEFRDIMNDDEGNAFAQMA
jgi:hypothetical protein